MTTPNQPLRQILEAVASSWDGEIKGIVKSASGEVVMKWKWDREKKQPVKTEG